MPNTRQYYRAFSGGEISPQMLGRIDDNKYQTGAALMRNFIALPQGPTQNRPGTKFVRATKDNDVARLIPFTFSITQTMVLEFGDGYLRFHTNGATLQCGTPAAYNAGTTYSQGALVSFSGVNYYYYNTTATAGNTPSSSPSYWWPLTGTIYEIPTPYAAADLFDIHYVQSGDILTLVHPNYAPRELRRYGATDWRMVTIAFASSVATPTGVTVTPSLGESLVIASATTASPAVFSTVIAHGFTVGDTVYMRGVTGTGGYTLADGFYTVATVQTVAPFTGFSLRNYDTGNPINITSGAYTANSGKVQFGTKIYDINNSYVVTAVKSGEGESAASSPVSVTNNLYVNGAYNTISWTAVSGATRYNIYKAQSGIYGYIGQASGTSFVDNNIAPDMGVTPPIYDTVFNSANNYPGAVSYYEQRRVFAGTVNDPQTIWMTRSGTESDMSYSIPTKDDDRVSVRVAAREANTIRHVVPLTQLLLLTNSAEWRVSPANSDTITPSTISVRPQSYVGANNVQPVLVNNTVVYCSARGGHVRELGYNWQAQGFITGDLSLRAAHLFDTFDIVDMTYAKSPQQVIWFVSASGKLLGLTYIPEEQIGAWHQHDTDGVFESCAAVTEGIEDALYVVVRREVDGNTVRYIERFASRQIDDVTTAVFTDSSLTYDGTNTTATTVTLSGGMTWNSSELLTMTSSTPIFDVPVLPPEPSDVHDAIVVLYGGKKYRCEILSVTSDTVALVKTDLTIPVGLRNLAVTTWEFARDTVSGLSHLEGKTVSILADGAVMPQQEVTGGTVVLQRAASYVTVGLPYESDLQSLPMVLNIDGYGQGRMKNVNKAWLRVYRSSGIFIGPDENNLVEAKQRTTEPYGSPPALKTDEILIVMTPAWASGGQVFVRQSDPLPLTILGLTTEVSIGG
jgi:hypothetical protein